MSVLQITTLCLCAAYAKPQYNYPAPSPPSGSYGAPGGGSISGIQGEENVPYELFASIINNYM